MTTSPDQNNPFTVDPAIFSYLAGMVGMAYSGMKYLSTAGTSEQRSFSFLPAVVTTATDTAVNGFSGLFSNNEAVKKTSYQNVGIDLAAGTAAALISLGGKKFVGTPYTGIVSLVAMAALPLLTNERRALAETNDVVPQLLPFNFTKSQPSANLPG